ncbi:hypothetical protein BU26DRAFT_515564 [Trematosphaeria pertusa]|uniref:CHASE domain-containing protein n=1 Tax=Trematosphaeria pertusa TaxID=390896 RepID=A0A6A6IUC0_9PLEO|nr:uncharacterized protein BU26DRAFT_515564 [Trematosphaeria pertusa]KAF2253190.1 hypothetical protein BU26DRAFT_515564 [Trematosphaeria pertusa]
MAEVSVVVAGSQDTTSHCPPHRMPHGKKRAADGSLESEQRLSKRFDLLNLVDSNGTRLYIPVAGSSDPADNASAAAKHAPKPVAPATEKKRERKPRPPPPDDCMQVEDTPHRVYIHDLAAELSDIESDEENPVFLSDIEKHLAKIPMHVLVGPEPKPTRDNQLVLYNIPSSLTVPEEQDSVRKAIVEARARVRERQANPTSELERGSATPIASMANGIVREIPIEMEEDPDAMDIDG